MVFPTETGREQRLWGEPSWSGPEQDKNKPGRAVSRPVLQTNTPDPKPIQLPAIKFKALPEGLQVLVLFCFFVKIGYLPQSWKNSVSRLLMNRFTLFLFYRT